MGQLQDRVAVVTGAGEGIGAAIARRFALEGARVLIAEIDEALGRATAEALAAESGTDTRFVRTDVGRKADNEAMIAAATDSWGRLDILVNNAWGGGKISRAELKTDALIDDGLAVGFRGPLWAMQAAFPIMKEQAYGRVINICSLNGVNAHMGTLEYNTAKEALRARDTNRGTRVGSHRHRVQRHLPGREVGVVPPGDGGAPRVDRRRRRRQPHGPHRRPV